MNVIPPLLLDQSHLMTAGSVSMYTLSMSFSWPDDMFPPLPSALGRFGVAKSEHSEVTSTPRRGAAALDVDKRQSPFFFSRSTEVESRVASRPSLSTPNQRIKCGVQACLR